MRARSLHPLHRASLVALAALPSLAGCGSAEIPEGPSSELGTSAAAITAAQAISNAEQWVTAKLLYCQSPNGKSDAVDPACPAICVRTSNPQWDPYRSDCSGLVSWAWGLPAPGRTTAEFAPNQSDITTVIQASALTTGDAVNTDDSAGSEHHIMLFKAWVTPGQTATFIEEPGCSSTPNYAHEFTSAVTLSGTSIKVAYNNITFKAIRYGALSSSPIYAAKYKAQSWPLSSAPAIPMTVGQAQKGSIDMTNTGTATWTAGVVKLAPIPRDVASNFHGPSWLSPTRVSTLAADVAPGAVGHFEWDLDPSQAGSFQPFFGLVAEGVTWFADSGGPPDNDMQVNVNVAPAPPGTGGSSSTTSSSAGAGGSAGTASGGTGAAGTGGTGTGGTGSGPVHIGGSNGQSSGCQMRGGETPGLMGFGLLAGWILARRRRRVA